MNGIFYVFAGYDYYPRGGVLDYRGRADTLLGAKECILYGGFEWWHIANEHMKIVASSFPPEVAV